MMHSCHQDGIHVPAVQRVLLYGGGMVSACLHWSSLDFNTSHAQKLPQCYAAIAFQRLYQPAPN